MEKEYEEKAKLRIEQAKREEEALRQRSLAELEGRLQSAMDDLEKKSQIQHDAWVDALFSHIVGEEAERGDGGVLRELFDYAAIGGKVHAMLGNRLRQEDFDKLMQMHTVPETAAFLLNTPGWGNCLQGMDVEHVHRGELEKRLRMGLAGEYDRLATFASKGMRQLLRAMAAKAEAVELLRFLRYFSAGHRQILP